MGYGGFFFLLDIFHIENSLVGKAQVFYGATGDFMEACRREGR